MGPVLSTGRTDTSLKVVALILPLIDPSPTGNGVCSLPSQGELGLASRRTAEQYCQLQGAKHLSFPPNGGAEPAW